MIKHTHFIALLLVICSWCVLEAGTFEGLEPGVSTKADADHTLGPPVREIVVGARYDYDASRYGARRISIRFDPRTQKIVTIDLHLDTTYAKSDYREWFGFGEPASTRTDDEGNLVESYLPQAISLHYTGPDESFDVAFFRHFDPGSSSRAASAQPAGPTAADNRLDSRPKPFLGATFANQHGSQGILIREVFPNTPADRAGIRPGDLILELGPHSLYRTNIDPYEFVALIGMSSTAEPTRLVIERGTRRFELWAQLELRDRQSIEAERKRLAFQAYQHGEALFRQGKYEEAIAPLQSAYNFNPDDGRTLELLGYCRLREKRYAEALRAYNGALQRMPNSPSIMYFIGACHDALGDLEQAVSYYQQYLASNDPDKKKRKYAGRRINAITHQPDESVDWNRAIVDIIEAVRQEMNDGG